MAYNEKPAGRIHEAIVHPEKVEEKKMFRGMCFMVHGRMCICVNDDGLMCRVDPNQHDTLIERPGTSEMIHGGKNIKGFIYVSKEVISAQKEFECWLNCCLEYNKNAKATKKAKKPAKKKR